MDRPSIRVIHNSIRNYLVNEAGVSKAWVLGEVKKLFEEQFRIHMAGESVRKWIGGMVQKAVIETSAPQDFAAPIDLCRHCAVQLALKILELEHL